MSDDIYPSDAELDVLTTFDGTPLELFEHVKEMWWPDGDSVKVDTGAEDGRVRVVMATGGWSGNESIIAALEDNTMFWALNWESSRRGGRHELVINPVWVNEPIIQVGRLDSDGELRLRDDVLRLTAWKEDVVDLFRRAMTTQRFADLYRVSGGELDVAVIIDNLLDARDAVVTVAETGDHAQTCDVTKVDGVADVCTCWKADILAAAQVERDSQEAPR